MNNKPDLEDDVQVEQLISKQQHKELRESIKALVSSIKSDKDKDAGLVKLFKQLHDSIISKVNEIAVPNISIPAALPPNVTVDNKELLECLERVEEKLQQLIDLRSADVEMVPTIGQWSQRIEKMTIKTILPKSKYQA